MAPPGSHLAAFAVALTAPGALLLQGCGDTTPATTTTETTTTATTTTTTTTTTKTDVGNCTEQNMDLKRMTDPKNPMWCFCFYSGSNLEDCQSHFVCPEADEPMGGPDGCVAENCGGWVFSESENAVSFMDKTDKRDVLTIPRSFYTDIDNLIDHCEDRGEEMLRQVLKQGRLAYKHSNITDGNPDAEWQCVHLPGQLGKLGVHWLHVHTFRGTVHGQPSDGGLPDVPPHAACAKVSLSLREAAAKIITEAAPPTPSPDMSAFV